MHIARRDLSNDPLAIADGLEHHLDPIQLVACILIESCR
jgi:hypothetical protein